MRAMIPLKRNPPKGAPKHDVSPGYKKKVLRQLKHPNVKQMTGRYRAKLGYSEDEGGYYARVVDAASDASVAESSDVYQDRKVALRVAASLLAGVYREGQQPQGQDWLKDLDDVITRIKTTTDSSQGSAQHPELTQASEEVKKALDKYRTELSKMAGAEAAFASEKAELMKAVQDYHPENLKEWLHEIKAATHQDDLRTLWGKFWALKNEIPTPEDESRVDHSFSEYIGLEPATDETLELNRKD